MPPPVQYCSWPAKQLGHSRQESTKQPTPTRSPTLNLVTCAPTAVTTPAISCPGTKGYCGRPHSALTVWMSEWQIPAKAMSKATSCGPGSRRVMVVLLSGSVGDVAA